MAVRPKIGVTTGDSPHNKADAMTVSTLSALLSVLAAAPIASVEPGPGFKKIVTIAGSGETGKIVQRGRADQVPLSNPFGIQPERDGSLIIASWDQHVIYRLDADYRRIEVIAGTGKPGISGDDGYPPRKIQLNQPHEIQVAPSGDIYVADTTNHRVGKINAGTLRWDVVAGTGEPGYAGDNGDARRAQFN
ncbi:MAG TPA: hypothetical protein DDW52_21605, partial [Planctomycetaceae bacterium]|nr:hypothetical protein [Planctomycetaceae bacterium]